MSWKVDYYVTPGGMLVERRTETTNRDGGGSGMRKWRSPIWIERRGCDILIWFRWPWRADAAVSSPDGTENTQPGDRA